MQLNHDRLDLVATSPKEKMETVLRRVSPCLLFVSALLAIGVLDGATQALAAPISTATTLTITSSGVTIPSGGSVSLDAEVTLTATVNAGSTTVSHGQVNFCDATSASCTDIHLLGTAQLIQSGPGLGTAVLRFHPGQGGHSYKAIFAGTPNGASAYAASVSSAVALTVTGEFPTKTLLVASGTPGNYSLQSTVTGLVNAKGTAAPSGSVSFLDTSNNNVQVASMALGAGTESSEPCEQRELQYRRLSCGHCGGRLQWGRQPRPGRGQLQRRQRGDFAGERSRKFFAGNEQSGERGRGADGTCRGRHERRRQLRPGRWPTTSTTP